MQNFRLTAMIRGHLWLLMSAVSILVLFTALFNPERSATYNI